MANQESKAKAPEAAAPRAKKSKLTLILLVLLVVMAGAAGFLGWKYFKVAKANTTEQAEGKDGHSEDDEEEATDNQKSKKRKKGKEKEKEEVKEGATVSFEPFLVNLADKEASRYLKTSVRLLVRDKESAEGISKGDVLMPRVRDTILSILATKTSAEVTTHEGKEKLKQEILKHVNEYLPHEDAQEVFFTDFVVQL